MSARYEFEDFPCTGCGLCFLCWAWNDNDFDTVDWYLSTVASLADPVEGGMF